MGVLAYLNRNGACLPGPAVEIPPRPDQWPGSEYYGVVVLNVNVSVLL
jgi:hypothetical protein